jgi:hypothetical protein
MSAFLGLLNHFEVLQVIDSIQSLIMLMREVPIDCGWGVGLLCELLVFHRSQTLGKGVGVIGQREDALDLVEHLVLSLRMDDLLLKLALLDFY